MIRTSSEEDGENAGGDEGGEGELRDGMSKPRGNWRGTVMVVLLSV
jgi:hypothetical protein